MSLSGHSLQGCAGEGRGVGQHGKTLTKTREARTKVGLVEVSDVRGCCSMTVEVKATAPTGAKPVVSVSSRLDVGAVLARNTLWNYLGFAVNLAINFALFPYAVRRLGAGPAGVWLLLGSVTGYMGLLELGIVP